MLDDGENTEHNDVGFDDISKIYVAQDKLFFGIIWQISPYVENRRLNHFIVLTFGIVGQI